VSKSDKERLDKVLVDRGLAPSRERAKSIILAGKVLVRGQKADKVGTLVAADDEVSLLEADHPYVSRGALKLIQGLDHFGIDPAGKVAIDVGASTGGFTDVLLRRGATRVYAVDVGYGQLAWSLRSDPRVVVMERQNMRDLDCGALDPRPELAVCDASFISLTLLLPKIGESIGPGHPAIVLVKPQFEVGKGEVGKGGVVREESKRRGAVDKVKAFAEAAGWTVLGDVVSPIEGPAGNVEYLLALVSPREGTSPP
jgi:23S rRNA (cytidine1920-2'-O)/16S rRNA (cytidine1409-2'-O)-methyltransferase